MGAYFSYCIMLIVILLSTLTTEQYTSRHAPFGYIARTYLEAWPVLYSRSMFILRLACRERIRNRSANILWFMCRYFLPYGAPIRNPIYPLAVLCMVDNLCRIGASEVTLLAIVWIWSYLVVPKPLQSVLLRTSEKRWDIRADIATRLCSCVLPSLPCMCVWVTCRVLLVVFTVGALPKWVKL